MPEPVPCAATGKPGAFNRAQGMVQAWLEGLPGAMTHMAASDLRSYSPYQFVSGYRISVEFSDGARRLDLLIPPGFPWKAGRIGLVDRPPFLTWPHIEKNGLICLAPSTMTINPEDPVGVAQYLLGDACGLVEKLIRGELEEDLRSEFLSYWNHAATGGSIVSLVKPAGPTREVRLWRGKQRYIVGDDETSIQRWLENRDGVKPSGFRTEPTGFYFLPQPPLPVAYPASGDMLRRLVSAAGADALKIFDRLVEANPEKLLSLFCAPTVHGPVLAATMVSRPLKERYGPHEPLARGFRPGRVPSDVVRSRYLGGGAIENLAVERADPSWVHGRGHDHRAMQLNGKTVAVVGCGSVGAPVAIALVQAGVGRIILVDPELLSWANIGRHPLGAASVGMSKAKALAERIRRDYPHVVAEHHVAELDEVLRLRAAPLDQCDLIVSATGSWSADSQLDAWQAAQRETCPIVYAWTEAHACAAHAVVIAPDGARLRDGFENTGVPLFEVTHWPGGATTLQEPACGAVYQPYGPVELGFVTNLVAETCLAVLLGTAAGSSHRIWAAPQTRIEALGGRLTDGWREVAGDRRSGGCIVEREWPGAAAQGGVSVAAA